MPLPRPTTDRSCLPGIGIATGVRANASMLQSQQAGQGMGTQGLASPPLATEFSNKIGS